jgi:diaminohydroxyphosphoribosylaminopyrimidine deaminase/5-amino-6-(5-phosphoribosylamino)uracil reductase
VNWTIDDYTHMSRAVRLARTGWYTTHPNPRVGCVLVRDGRLIGAGWHEYAGGPHAEVNALTAAGEEARGADCYVTLEPCSHTGRTPPCADALIGAGIRRLITAMPDPNPAVAGRGLERLRRAGVVVETGLLESRAVDLNPGFIKRMTEQLPYVRCKLAMSLDGRTAMAGGESAWISGVPSRMDVQRLRAQSAAIMTGIGTVLADDPRLTVRDIDTGGRQPLRVVIDPQLKFPNSARMLKEAGRTLIFTQAHNKEIAGQLTRAGAEIIVLPADGFLSAVHHYLALTEEINEVLLESGARLAGSMLNLGLLDEVIVYQAPLLMGDGARGLFHLPDIKAMSHAVKIEITDTRKIGKDQRITFKVQHSTFTV